MKSWSEKNKKLMLSRCSLIRDEGYKAQTSQKLTKATDETREAAAKVVVQWWRLSERR